MDKLTLEAYRMTGCEPTNYIGGTKWSLVEDWHNLVDYHIRTTPPPLFGNMVPLLMKNWKAKRFMTYDEYLNDGQRKLLRTYDDSEQGYFAYMQKVNQTLWEFFFAWNHIAIPRKERIMHTYSFGASGCGKTELIKNQFLEDVKAGGVSVILIDPNGDAALQLAKAKENVGNDNLIYIDPFLDHSMTPVVNPFDLPNKHLYIENHMYKTIVEKRASQIMQALLQIFADADAKFSEKMQSYLFPAICVVMLKPDGDMTDLLRLFDDGDNSDLIELGKKSPNAEHALLFQQGFNVVKTTKEAVRDKLKNMLNHGNLRDLITGKSTIDLEKAINEKKHIIFNLAKGKLDPKPSLYYGKFIISTIQSIIFQRAVNENYRVPVFIYIDEFHNYINDDIKELLNEGRKYGVHLWLASQTIWQEMTPSIKDAVGGNTNVRIVGELRDTTKLDAVSTMLDIDKDVVKHLPKYQFLVKVGKSKTFRMHPSKKNLGNSNAMTPEQWQVVKKNQLAKYYRPIIHKTKPMPPEDTDEFKPKFDDE